MTPMEIAGLAARDAIYADQNITAAWAWDEPSMGPLRSYWTRIAQATITAYETARQEALTAEFVEHARTVGSL